MSRPISLYISKFFIVSVKKLTLIAEYFAGAFQIVVSYLLPALLELTKRNKESFAWWSFRNILRMVTIWQKSSISVSSWCVNMRINDHIWCNYQTKDSKIFVHGEEFVVLNCNRISLICHYVDSDLIFRAWEIIKKNIYSVTKGINLSISGKLWTYFDVTFVKFITKATVVWRFMKTLRFESLHVACNFLITLSTRSFYRREVKIHKKRRTTLLRMKIALSNKCE